MKEDRNKEKNNRDNKGMKKSLGVASVFAICTGAAFSSGFFLLPGFAAGITGPSLPLAFLVAGIFMLPAIFTMSELSSAMPRAGGPYFFLTRSFGPFIGIIAAVGKYLQLIFKGAFAFVGAGIYIDLIFDVHTEYIAGGLIVLFTIINLSGIKQTAKTEKILVLILIILISYFIFAGILEIKNSRDSVSERFHPFFPFGIDGFIAAIALVFLSFGGMGQVASVSEEVKNPSYSIPRGMFWGLAVSIFFYICGTAIMILLIDPANLQGDQVPAATAVKNLNIIFFPVLAIVIAALAAFASTGNAAILSAARYPLALSRDKLLLKKFSKLDNSGTPTNAIIITGIILLILTLAFDVQQIAKIGSAFLLFVFLAMCIALIIFRESKKGEYQPGYYSPLYPWMQILGGLVYLSLIIVSGMEAVLFILAIIFMSYIWYFLVIKERPSFSAAIYPLFRRMGQSENHVDAINIADMALLEDSHLSPVVDRAIVINSEDQASFEENVRQAAHAIKERLGGEKEAIEKMIYDEAIHKQYSLKFNISLVPILLEKIEQPEMVIIDNKFTFNEKEQNGMIILIDDQSSSQRLFKLVSQINTAFEKEDFPEKWENAKSTKELKKTLKNDVNALSLKLEGSKAVESFIEKRIADIEIPKGSLIAFVQREGRMFVPQPDTILKKGDEIIILAENKAFEVLVSNFK